MTTPGPVEWMVFWIAVALAVDIGVARYGGRARPLGSTQLCGVVYGSASECFFGAWVALRLGGEAGTTYLTAYLVEESLSVDNLFLFVLIFAQTGVPASLQHRALFWGIAGALIMRAILIALGVYLLARFHWVIYPFAALLVFAAARMLWGKEKETMITSSVRLISASWHPPATRVCLRSHTESAAELRRVHENKKNRWRWRLRHRIRFFTPAVRDRYGPITRASATHR